MNLPNALNARVEREKVIGYLLNAKHPFGGPKATFFAQFGFETECWEVFASSLLQHGRDYPVRQKWETVFGPRYAIEGRIVTPDGRDPNIHTIWQMDRGELAPRLITAYPARDSK